MIISLVCKSSRKRRRNFVVQYLRPLIDSTVGGESVMIRYLDDTTTPCFSAGWLKADKNRYHQERAPGSSKKYIFNPDSWVYKFRNSLTAVSVANSWLYPGNSVLNDGWGSKRGVTLVTPRHVICSHGGLGVGTPGFPTTFRFVGTDGETYDRTAIGSKYCSADTPVSVNGISHGGDVSILTLDSDLPPEVIPVRNIPNHPKFKSSYAVWDELFISQSIELDSFIPTSYGEQVKWYPANQPFPVTHYPRRHRSMCGLPWSTHPKVGYLCWGGDSGMPLFYGYGEELLFAGFALAGGSGANTYPIIQSGVTITWEDLINQIIIDADTDAINRGSVLTVPTGYTIMLATDIPDLLPP